MTTNLYFTVPMIPEWRIIEETNVGPVTSPPKTTFDDIGTVIRVEHRKPLTKVVVELPEGIKATGWSRCVEGDKYSREFGEHIATTRAVIRALQKYEKLLVRNGNA